MKKLLLIVLFVAIGDIYSQADFRVSMGLNFSFLSDIPDYINSNYAPKNDQVPDANTLIEFGGEFGYEISPNYQIGVETAYEAKSFKYSFYASNYEFNYSMIMPSLIAYYYIKAPGYKFKFGAGVGPRFATVTESIYTNNGIDYSSTGYGFVLKADGSTKLSDFVFAYIGMDLRFNILNELSTGSNYIVNPNTNNNVSFNSFSAGIKLGLSFIF